MKSTFVKYFIFLSFIIMSVILFFAGRIMTEYIYDRFMYTDGLIDNAFSYMYFMLKSWGVYVFLLLIIAAVGLVSGKKANKSEVYKGFMFSMIFSLLLLVIYIVLLLDAFVF